MGSLVVATASATTIALAHVLGANGWNWADIGMVLLFALNAPWVALGFWNAVIGVALSHLHRDPLSSVVPIVQPTARDARITTRTAIVMPVCNEAPERVFRHLQTVVETLDAAGDTDGFEIFLLSDSSAPAIVKDEAARFAAWQARDRQPGRLHYRRRQQNVGHKVGNIREFCDRWGDRFDHMVVLDADSVMGGERIVELVRLMQVNPQLGILQTLPVGLPALSPFARIFQYGMRHGLRAYTLGSAWWQGGEGPYWGHNAIIRLEAFRRHCRLPRLPGRPPFGGDILSHDVVEAVLMHRAGYEVRVLPQERGSFEENPPTLPDFVKRDLRWCQGNLQHIRLLPLPGLRPMGRLHLLLGVLMYLAAPLWLGFMLLGFGQVVADPSPLAAAGGPVAASQAGIALFGVMLTMTLAPKLLGILDVLLVASRRAAYGGTRRVLAGAAADLGLSLLMAPVIGVTQTIFIIGLLLGRRVTWDAQLRDDRAVPIAEALRGLWPHKAIGLIGTLGLAFSAPATLPWAAPILIGLSVSVPFTCLTSRLGWGRRLARARLCATPEEITPPTEIRLLCVQTPVRPESAPTRHERLPCAPAAAAVPASSRRP